MPKKKQTPAPAATQQTLEKYLSVNDVAAALGISDQVVHNLLKEGKLPYSKIGRRIIIRLRDVEALLEESRCE